MTIINSTSGCSALSGNTIRVIGVNVIGVISGPFAREFR